MPVIPMQHCRASAAKRFATDVGFKVCNDALQPVATATSKNTQSNAIYAMCGFTRYWKARTRDAPDHFTQAAGLMIGDAEIYSMCDGIAEVTLNRPQALNALTLDMVRVFDPQ